MKTNYKHLIEGISLLNELGVNTKKILSPIKEIEKNKKDIKWMSYKEAEEFIRLS